MYVLCVSGAVNTQGFVGFLLFFMRYIWIFIQEDEEETENSNQEEQLQLVHKNEQTVSETKDPPAGTKRQTDTYTTNKLNCYILLPKANFVHDASALQANAVLGPRPHSRACSPLPSTAFSPHTNDNLEGESGPGCLNKMIKSREKAGVTRADPLFFGVRPSDPSLLPRALRRMLTMFPRRAVPDNMVTIIKMSIVRSHILATGLFPADEKLVAGLE